MFYVLIVFLEISIPKWSDFSFHPQVISLENFAFQSQNGLILVGPKFALFALTFTIISPNLYIYFAIPDLSIVLYGLTTFKSDFFEILSKYNHNHLIFR